MFKSFAMFERFTVTDRLNFDCWRAKTSVLILGMYGSHEII
jgi:hypothetical protein